MAEEIKFDLTVGKDQLNPSIEKGIKSSNGLRDALTVAAGVFAGNIATKGFQLLGDAISGSIDIIKESIDAAAGQEQANQNLNTALALTGKFSKEASDQILGLASEIQNLTTLEDDAVLGASALIQNLGKLSVDGLDRATRAAVDLSAALGIDLTAAATLVGKAATGNVDSFSRYGIAINKGKTDTETFSNTLNALEGSFKGAAEAQAKTFGGSLIQLKNAIGDSKEELGNIITQNPAVIAAFRTAQTAVVQLANSFKESFSGQSLDLAGVFIGLLDGVNAVVLSVDAIGRVFTASVETSLAAIRTLALGIVTPVAGVLELLALVPGIGDSFKSMADAATSEMLRLSDAFDKNVAGIDEAINGQTFLSGVSDGIAEARTNFEVFFQDLKNNPAIPINVTTNAGEIEAVGQEILTARQNLALELQNLDATSEIERQNQAEQFRLAGLAATDEKRQQEIQSELEYQLAKNDAAYQAELAKNALILDAEQQRLANSVSFRKKDLADSAATNKATVEDAKRAAQLETQIEQTRISALQGFLGAGLALAKQGSKEQKALQIAQATVSTYTAANQALSSPPGPPFTLPLVAATIAQGLANVSRITQQSFATGGIIGQSQGATTGGDNRLATVRDGEMVLDASQQKTLFDAIKSGSFGGGDIVVQVDGREIARAVRNQKQMGFAV